MDQPPGGERAAAIRAAHHWRGLDKKEFAAALNLSERQVSRIESGQAKKLDPGVLAKIAEVTGVPMWFLEHGFRPPPSVTANLEVAALRSELRHLSSQLTDVSARQAATDAEVSALSAAVRRTTPRSQQEPPQ